MRSTCGFNDVLLNCFDKFICVQCGYELQPHVIEQLKASNPAAWKTLMKRCGLPTRRIS